ncbi:hypothetical protein ACLB2K_031300 [Fragaria x ananassa]
MSSSSGTMPPRRRPRVAYSTNANEGEEVRGLGDSIGAMLRGVLDRVQPPRSVKKRDVADAGAVEFKGAKGPFDAYSWVDKMEMAFESTELPEEKKEKYDGAQTMTWEQFKALFLGQYFNHSHPSRIQSDFLNMKKRDDEGVIEFEQRFTTLSYHVPHLIPDERTRIGMFVDTLGGVFADKIVGAVYPTFLDAVGAAMAIETRGTYRTRPQDFSGPSQGPSKKAASSSASGSSAGSGRKTREMEASFRSSRDGLSLRPALDRFSARTVTSHEIRLFLIPVRIGVYN